jgi:hypothetical protein
MKPSLHSLGLELVKLSAPQGFVRALRERGVRKVMREYLNHSALNAGQAARDVAYFFDHPHANAVAATGTMKHRLASAKARAKSLGNNLLYTIRTPHSHHEVADVIAKKPVRARDMFRYGFNPFDNVDPTKMP